MWHYQINAGILNNKALYEYKTRRMSGKYTRDWVLHTKNQLFWQKIVLRGHPSHYQECYHDELTCNVNKVYMILLISIYVFLISMGLFPQLSPKEIIFHSQWKRFHKYQIYCSVFIVVCVTYVYDIETISQICSLTVAKVRKLFHLDGNNTCWSYLM